MATFALMVVIGASPTAAMPPPDPEPTPEPLPAPEPAPSPEPAVPTFVDGLSQAVFGGSATWISSELWVETDVDSDLDGKLDRIHVDVTRVQETESDGLKVPVLFEISPYYANLGPARNWPVNYELGLAPPPRLPEPYFTARVTSPTISTIYESTWVPRGYAVVHAESLGTGLSDGCPTSGAPNETEGGKAVVDWLNGRAPGFTTRSGDVMVDASWTTGKVGMLGTSYNGTLPIAVATTGVEGLEAIVPISAISDWYDYYRANGMVRAPFTFQGEDLDVLADAVYSRADEPAPGPRTICRPVIDSIAVQEDRTTGDRSPFWDDRNYMKDVDDVHAATLLAHGNADFNVMTKNAAQFYEAIKANGVPHQFYFHQGGHGGSPPDVMLNRWFTRYLYGVQNGVEALPKSWVVRETTACPPRQTTVVGDQSNTATLTVADTSPFSIGFTLTVPQTNASGTITNTTRLITSIPDSTHLVLASAVATAAGQRVVDGAIVSLVCGTANPTPYPEWPDPASAPAVLNFTPGAPARGGLTFQAADPSAVPETLVDNAFVTAATSMNAASSNVRLVYQTPVLSTAVRISGTPTVSIRAAFSKPKANLTAVLISYPGTTGNGTILTRGWQDPENRDSDSVSEPVTPGQFYTFDFDLQPKDVVVAGGRRLAVMILSSDNEATIRPAAGTELTFDLAHSTASIPIVGGGAALAAATGVVAPTVAYTLDPVAPNGENGWYSSGDVALAWQVPDNGAETTKTGCVDETFSTDGTFTRSCTATNVVGTTGPVEATVKRDTAAPTVSANVSGTPGLGGYRPANPTVTLTAADATSGIARIEQSLDGEPFQTYSAPFVVSGDGPHTVDYRAIDNAGHTSDTGSVSFLVDANAPTTAASVSPPALGGIHRTPKVTLAADDGLGIGVAGVQYTVDGSGTRSYTAPFWVTGDGLHTVTFRAVDMLGKIETTKTITFTVDGSPPMSKATLSPAPVAGHYVDPIVTLSANDFESTGGSGVASIEYLLDSGAWTTYSGPFQVTGDGPHSLQWHATDNAGNVEAVKSKTFNVDATGPAITVFRPAGTYTLGASVLPSFTCTDDWSGVASCSGPATVDTRTIGTKAFTITATDLAGNTSTLTRNYNVVWPFSGLSVPGSAKAGTRVKVRFGLGGNRGTAIVSSQGSAAVECDALLLPGSWGLAPGESLSSPSYSSGTGLYTITWQTVPSWQHTCRMVVLVLADGTTHTAVVEFP
jgi:predicted acyl esterase